ncbi:MAG: UDP-N-acetylglucosamine 1-carboxyvinyltransferase [Aggregatilineales bacterium]
MSSVEQLVIEGGHRLSGAIRVNGNKNSALKLIAACLLTDEPVILRNVPDIADVRVMCDILRGLGAQVEWQSDHTLRIHAENIRTHRVDPKLASTIRASIVLAGPMLARYGQLDLPAPGGDVIGRRRLDTHVLALTKLGARIDFNGAFHMQADGLTGATILLDEASVTATENAIMAATLAHGTTTVGNAASEPHVQDLCHFLNGCGAQIDGIGSNTVTIQGVSKLHGGEFRVGADYLEVGSFIGAAAMTGSELRIQDADPHILGTIALVFARLGVTWQVEGNDILVPRSQTMMITPDLGNRIPQIKTQTWPGFPTDLLGIVLAVATQSAGTVLFHEWMYENRLFFTDKLTSMGARIVLCDPHRALVQGPTVLHGDLALTSPDIRAGMTLLLAALCAQGTTIIRNVGQIDRGYERVDERLRALGAHIHREPAN